MDRRCSEPDWRVYREVSAKAIERFCEQTLDEIVTIAHDAELPVMQRLAKVADLSRRQRSTLDRDFLALARSRVLMQLAAMQAHGLLRPDEIARFSPELQASLAILAD